jgi:hypothetical protein
MSSRFIDYDIMMGLLRVYAKAPRSLHICNVLGAPYRVGDLERELEPGMTFELEERAQAYRCARELEDAGLIVADYGDLSNPEQWRNITDAGREALKRGALDELDAALGALSPSFIEMRRGAWRAANSTLPDTHRQAAHSARELVNQVLHAVAPDEEVVAQLGYQPRPDGKITRRDRYKLAVRKRARGWSDTDIDVLDKATALIESQRTKLDGLAHSRDAVVAQTVQDALQTIDMVLRLLLV